MSSTSQPEHRHRHRPPHMKRQRVDFRKRRIQHRHRTRLERHHEGQLGFVVPGKLHDRVDVDAMSRQCCRQRSNDTRTVGNREAHVMRGGEIDAHLNLAFELRRRMHLGAQSRARNRHQVRDHSDRGRITAGAESGICGFPTELAVHTDEILAALRPCERRRKGHERGTHRRKQPPVGPGRPLGP